MSLSQEDLKALSAPFDFYDHEFREGYVYIREDAITNRIETVDPDWQWLIRGFTVRDTMVTAHGVLALKGVERDGIGSQQIMSKGEPEKGAATDALKRAARLFGIGRYLLNAPNGEAEFRKWLGSGDVLGRSSTIAKNIETTRKPDLKPDHSGPFGGSKQSSGLSGNQFVATRIQKKTKEDKSWYLLFSEDQQTFASSWELSKYEIFNDEDRAEFEDGAEHFITPVVVTWKADGKFKKVTGMAPAGDEFQGLTF